jgi:proteasome activator subunit 4
MEVIDPLLFETDKHKQRAGAEILVGMLRGELPLRAILKSSYKVVKNTGSKHWTTPSLTKLWSWTTARLHRIVAQIKPDTISLWESIFQVREPKNSEWIQSQWWIVPTQ